MDGWLLRLLQFIDCCTFGVIGHDLIDFNEIKIQFNKLKKKMYNVKKTPQLEEYLLKTMPRRFQYYQSIIHKIGFKDPITPQIKKIWEEHLKFNKDKFCDMTNDDTNENFSYMSNVNDDDDQSSQSSDINTDDEECNLMTNMNATQILQRMQQSTFSQFSQVQ